MNHTPIKKSIYTKVSACQMHGLSQSRPLSGHITMLTCLYQSNPTLCFSQFLWFQFPLFSPCHFFSRLKSAEVPVCSGKGNVSTHLLTKSSMFKAPFPSISNIFEPLEHACSKNNMKHHQFLRMNPPCFSHLHHAHARPHDFS